MVSLQVWAIDHHDVAHRAVETYSGNRARVMCRGQVERFMVLAHNNDGLPAIQAGYASGRLTRCPDCDAGVR